MASKSNTPHPPSESGTQLEVSKIVDDATSQNSVGGASQSKRMSVHPPAAPKRTMGREMKNAEFYIPFEYIGKATVTPNSLSKTENPLTQSTTNAGCTTFKPGMTAPKSYGNTTVQMEATGTVNGNTTLKAAAAQGKTVRYFPEWALLSNNLPGDQEEEGNVLAQAQPDASGEGEVATAPPTPAHADRRKSQLVKSVPGVHFEDGEVDRPTLRGHSLDQFLAPERIVGSKAEDWIRFSVPSSGTLQRSLKTTYKGVRSAEVKDSLMAAFWDSILATTGYSKEELEFIRTTPDPRDICETPTTTDYDFATVETIETLRQDLENYIEALRTLQGMNQERSNKQLKLKSFVEDTKYKNAREQEAILRLTPSKVANRFKNLTYTGKKIKSITQDIADLFSLEELILTNCLIERVAFLPENLLIASFDGNCVTDVSNRAMEAATKLVFLGLSCNSLTASSLEFLQASESLVIVDLSYNEISDLKPVVAALKEHPTIRELDLSGNPVAFLPKYRSLIAALTPIHTLDGVPITENERNEFRGTGASEAAIELAFREPIQLNFAVESLDGVLSLVPRSLSPEEAEKGPAGKGGKDKGKAADKNKKGKGVVEEPHANTALYTVKKTEVVLKGSWLGSDVNLITDLMQVPPPPAEEEGTAGKKSGAKDTKSGKKGAGHDQAPTILDHLPLKHSAKLELDSSPQSLERVPEQLFYPIKLQCSLVDTMANDTTQEVQLGQFHVDLAKVCGPRLDQKIGSSLGLNSVLIAETQLAIAKQKVEIEKLVVADRELDKIHLESPTPTEGHPPAGKGKGQQKGANAKGAANEELLQKQQESALRKVEIEEANMKLQSIEHNLQRYQNVHLGLKVQFSTNPPPPVVTETPSETPRTEDGHGKGKDKKKKK